MRTSSARARLRTHILEALGDNLSTGRGSNNIATIPELAFRIRLLTLELTLLEKILSRRPQLPETPTTVMIGSSFRREKHFPSLALNP